MAGSKLDNLKDIDDGVGGVYDDVLTVFHASPLVAMDDDGEIIPLDALSLDREHHHLTGVLEQVVNVGIHHKACTPRNFRDFLNNGGRILHFACHEENDMVYMEHDHGRAELVSLTELKGWIRDSGVELVVVTDCSPTMKLVEAFEGVPHVVCCSVLRYKLDETALEFCQAFYRALAKLETVGAAFLAAGRAVRDSTRLNYTGGRQATEKYRLLPEGKNHNTVVFEKRDELNKIAAPAIPQVRILPQPPQVFVGRQVNVYELLCGVKESRLVRIASGMGGASIVKAACQYMARRREEFLHDIVWLPPRLGQMDGLTSLCLRVFDSLINLKAPVQDDLVRLIDILKNRMVLLVCDIRESDGSFVVLMDFLDEVFELTSDTKAIVIQNEIDAVPVSLSTHYSEKAIQVQPLGYSSSVSLFGLLCPHIAKGTVPSITSFQDFKDLLVPTAGYVGNVKLKSTIVNIYNLLGSGNPSQIRELACSMTSEEFESLIEVGKLRLHLSRLYQKHIETLFPTRYSLDCHLGELLHAIEDARKDRKLEDLKMLEAKYVEDGSRRKELPSVETMLTKRKALKTDLRMSKLSGRCAEAERMSSEILTIEKMIRKEREAMMNRGEDWIRLSYVEYPHGISRRTLENRYSAKEHLLLDARKTGDYRLARELEFPLKELRECRTFLLDKSSWERRREKLNHKAQEAKALGDVDLLVKSYDQITEIERRLADEEGDVDSTRISDDLFLSLTSFLRYTGDPIYGDLPVFDDLTSRAQADECLKLIREKAQTFDDALDAERYNTLLGLYKELCAVICSSFPSIEVLLIERRGLMLELALVVSDDKEITQDFEREICDLEGRIQRERGMLGPDVFYGVCKEVYFQGITRTLVDKRIMLLKSRLEEARDEEDVFDVADLELSIEELEKYQDRLPTTSELGVLITKSKQDLDQLIRCPGNAAKKMLLELAVQDLQRRYDDEKSPNGRAAENVADELLIPVQDYFYPPMSDSSTDLNDEEHVSERRGDRSYLTTVDEKSDEGAQSVDDTAPFLPEVSHTV